MTERNMTQARAAEQAAEIPFAAQNGLEVIAA
jgi:hypothetical protein